MRYQLHYWSADSPGASATWSVYVEEYLSPDHSEPIDGSTRLVSTWPTEAEAEAEAHRLQRGTVEEESATATSPSADFPDAIEPPGPERGNLVCGSCGRRRVDDADAPIPPCPCGA